MGLRSDVLYDGIHIGYRSDVLYVKGYTWVGGQMFCMSMDTHWL